LSVAVISFTFLKGVHMARLYAPRNVSKSPSPLMRLLPFPAIVVFNRETQAGTPADFVSERDAWLHASSLSKTNQHNAAYWKK
jgi:hypothetical protein